MSITQFAMVEELASLIKDNFQSRHLVLTIEEALVNYLQDDSSADGTLELEPMSSYNRLILHRLADIFGFAHESVGEGDDRHLVLQRCFETSVPFILVSDILWQYDSCESSPVAYQLLRRDETSTLLKMNTPASSPNFLEREAAYLSARERIFGVEDFELKEATRQKPRHDPIVARRMIAHALGQRINKCSQVEDDNNRCSDGLTDVSDIEQKIKVDLDLHQETASDSRTCLDKDVRCVKQEAIDTRGSSSEHYDKISSKTLNRKSSDGVARSGGRDGLENSVTRMRQENLGAAKRMFAHALGIQASKDSVPRGREVRKITE